MKNKKLLLVALMLMLIVLISGCYMEPDRVSDDGNGLTIGQNNQQFDPVVTATPEATAQPTPIPTTGTQQLDWSSWDFGAATNPPSNVATAGTATAQPQQGATTGVISITATPSPTPGASATVLKSGSQGTAVSQLQTRLKELGYYTGTVDGSYGAGTTSAVTAFQAANNLTSDGIAGKTTQERLYSYYAVAKKDATVTARPTAKPSTSTSTSKTTTTTTTQSQYTNGKTDIYLKLGSTGSQVKILQNRLIVLGYISGTADGSFYETTEAAVIAFQKRNGLYADGIAGPSTLKLLYSQSAKKANAVAANLGSLKEGMNGSGVRALQQQLKNLGFYTGSVDGDFGAGTKAAVIAFQASRGLTQDGVAGKQTMNAIYGSSGGSSSASSSSSGTNAASYALNASTNGYSSLSSGSTNTANVIALQQALRSSGHYSGSVDGSYGAGTTSAVTSFQKSKGLRADGIAGPTTQRLLYGGTSESGSYSKLSSGSSGGAVRNLQYTLYELKYYDGSITGRYDSDTKSAVIEFQQTNGLTADGIAGQATQRLLYSSYALPAGKGTGGGGGGGGGSAPSGKTYSTVSQGEASDTVLQIQQELIALGYMSNLTSVYDSETVTAVATFVAYNTSKLDSIGGSYRTDGTQCGNTIQKLLFDGSPNRR